jgi:hypothetical protein
MGEEKGKGEEGESESRTPQLDCLHSPLSSFSTTTIVKFLALPSTPTLHLHPRPATTSIRTQLPPHSPFPFLSPSLPGISRHNPTEASPTFSSAPEHRKGCSDGRTGVSCGEEGGKLTIGEGRAERSTRPSSGGSAILARWAGRRRRCEGWQGDRRWSDVYSPFCGPVNVLLLTFDTFALKPARRFCRSVLGGQT